MRVRKYKFFVKYIHLKRIIDVSFSVFLLIITLPITIITGLLVYVKYGTIFFLQKRPGLNSKIITIYKFKTMNNLTDKKGQILQDEFRLDKFGKLIRSLSIDELPQLINVIKGDMSIVGPRPLLPEYLSLYNSFQMRRHEVKPGITGWAQVNGRNAISWQLKFEYDVYYVDHMSFLLDLKILRMTIVNVIRGTGVNQDGYASVEYFKGN